MRGIMDLGAFKGVDYDMKELKSALVAQPGQEAVGRGRKAIKRLRKFMQTVPEPQAGQLAALDRLDRCLNLLIKPDGLFRPASTGHSLEFAERDFDSLRRYLTGLEWAWKVCYLDPAQADKAAGYC